MNDLRVLVDVYTCQLKYNMNITSLESTFILSSAGTHLGQKSYDDVVAIDAKNKNIQYFPKGLELNFKNLKTIDFQSGRLIELFHFSQFLTLPSFDSDYLFTKSSELKKISYFFAI